MLRRSVPLLIVASLSTLFLFVVFTNVSWRRLPQTVGLGEVSGPTEKEKANALPDLRAGKSKYQDEWRGNMRVGEGAFREPKIDSHSPYPVGETKPAGENYTKCLVIPRLSRENVDWIDEEMGDLIDSGALRKAVYTVDDHSAKFHPPKNKGHEVMVYLTYIIDFYDELEDVSIFMHAHRWAWHNNELLDTDASLMIRHLSPERVTREGYMNLRCHWDPGCPSWLHPGAVERDPMKQEEELLAESWAQLFPLDPVPNVLAQPCCAQFAVSRERIRATPKERYKELRKWVIQTPLSDYLSGRVFEYIWQFIFTASPIHCPSMSACYCDGYGLCFGSAVAFDHWFELRFEHNEYVEELRQWREQADMIEAAIADNGGHVPEEALLSVPVVGRDKKLERWIEESGEEMEELKRLAFERGQNAKQRALESGREWKEGDGF